MKARKLPIEVECWRTEPYTSEPMPKWLYDALRRGEVIRLTDGYLIETLQGPVRASPGDWIIKGIKEELYAIKDNIMQMSYELIPESEKENS